MEHLKILKVIKKCLTHTEKVNKKREFINKVIKKLKT